MASRFWWKVFACAVTFAAVMAISHAYTFGGLGKAESASILWEDENVRIYGQQEIRHPGTYSFTIIQGKDPNIKVGSFSVRFSADDRNPDPPVPIDTWYAGRLWAVLILPDNLTDEHAALRTNRGVVDALAERGVVWRSYLESEEEVSTPGWRSVIEKAGSIPVTLWIGLDSADKPVLLRTTKWPFGQKEIVSEMEKVRGPKG